MNITDVNRFITALNRFAEGATMLARTIEETAWESFEDHAGMSGVRPIAAAQLVEPELEAKAQNLTVSSKPDPSVTQASPTSQAKESVSLEQVRAVLSELSQSGHTARVRELIQATGVQRLSEVAPVKYGWLLEQAEGITDA